MRRILTILLIISFINSYSFKNIEGSKRFGFCSGVNLQLDEIKAHEYTVNYSYITESKSTYEIEVTNKKFEEDNLEFKYYNVGLGYNSFLFYFLSTSIRLQNGIHLGYTSEKNSLFNKKEDNFLYGYKTGLESEINLHTRISLYTKYDLNFDFLLDQYKFTNYLTVGIRLLIN